MVASQFHDATWSLIMLTFLLHRIWQSLVLLLLVSIIGFAILNLAPGGPLSQFALTPGMTREALDRIAHQMGLDRPLPVQYLEWAWRLLQGDWGNPIATNVRFSISSPGICLRPCC